MNVSEERNEARPQDKPISRAKLTIMAAVAGAMAIFIVLTIGFALTGLWLSSTAGGVLQEQPRVLEGLSDTKDLERNMVGLDATMNRYLASTSPDDKKAFSDGVNEARGLLQKIERRNPAAAKLTSAFNGWIDSASKSIRIMTMLGDTEVARKVFNQEIETYANSELARLDSARELTSARFDAASRLQMTVLVLTLLLVLAIGWTLHDLLVKPLQRLIQATRELAAGERAIDLDQRFRLRDLSELQDALRVFYKNADEREQLVQSQLQSATKHDRAEKVRSLIADFEEEMRLTLARLNTSAAELTRGSKVLGDMSQAAATEAKTADQISEELTTAVSVLMSSAEEIKIGVGQVALGAGMSQEASEQAVVEARQMRTTMEELQQLANDIGDILEIIKRLASQTNLLALNATIEAARAGEQGRGFAVVAAEVKMLASQSAGAADEIAGKISAIQQASERTMDAITKVDTIVSKSSTHATSVASAVRQQNAAIDSMADSLRITSDASQHSADGAARVRDSVQSTEEIAKLVEGNAGGLTSESELLQERISQFLSSVRAA